MKSLVINDSMNVFASGISSMTHHFVRNPEIFALGRCAGVAVGRHSMFGALGSDVFGGAGK
jgi:hypothetical protein